jgi:hypothetical protein
MPLSKIQLKPGINREVTSYTNEGGWYDGNKIRFRFGFPEKIGGWVRKSSKSFLGTCRALHSWVTLSNEQYIGVGTNLKYYVERGGGFNDITPIASSNLLNKNISIQVLGTSATGGVGSPVKNESQVYPNGVAGSGGVGTVYVGVDGGTVIVIGEAAGATGLVGSVTLGGDVYSSISVSVTGLQASGFVSSVANTQDTVTFSDDVSFAAVNGSSTITVTINADHNALVGQFVTFTGAIGLGGNITAGVLNQEYEIATVPSSTTFTFEARQAGTSISSITVDGQLSPSPVVANASDTGDGGDAIEAFYQIPPGLNTAVSGAGWGVGTWSRGAWGSASNQPIVTNQLRLWSHDNFGEDLLMNVRDGGLYYWDASAGLSTRAVALSSLPGANTTPTIAKQIMVSDRDRHVLAFGCDPQATPGTQDPLTIRFSSQESLTDWAATATNSAGELRLGSGSEIIRAVETRQQILVFTDTTLYAMQYLGPPFTFGVGAISENISIQSPNSVIAVDDAVFWMGNNEFYAYSGRVENLPCSVRDYVFDDFNQDQALKVAAALNSTNTEVWWFYPSANSENNDRYVVFNYGERVWYYGTLPRTAWIDRGIFDNPIAASTDHYLYYQELGFDDGSTNPASAITSYVESSPIDIGDGQQFMFISRLLPDLSFLNSTNGSPTATFTTAVRNYQQGSFNPSTTSTFTPNTEQFFLRLRGRQMTIRVGSTDAGMTWRLGSPRYDIRPDGRR